MKTRARFDKNDKIKLEQGSTKNVKIKIQQGPTKNMKMKRADTGGLQQGAVPLIT